MKYDRDLVRWLAERTAEEIDAVLDFLGVDPATDMGKVKEAVVKAAEGLKLNDSDRIDFLEKKGFGAALLSDDNGHWAVATGGIQNVALDRSDIETMFVVLKDEWRSSIRDAVDSFIKDCFDD